VIPPGSSPGHREDGGDAAPPTPPLGRSRTTPGAPRSHLAHRRENRALTRIVVLLASRLTFDSQQPARSRRQARHLLSASAACRSVPIPPAVHGRRPTPRADTPLHHKHSSRTADDLPRPISKQKSQLSAVSQARATYIDAGPGAPENGNSGGGGSGENDWRNARGACSRGTQRYEDHSFGGCRR